MYSTTEIETCATNLNYNKEHFSFNTYLIHENLTNFEF